MRNAYKISVGSPEGKRPVERHRRRWDDYFRMNLTEVGWDIVDWIHLGQDRDKWLYIVDTVMNLRIP
jgi:hypothetical protein